MIRSSEIFDITVDRYSNSMVQNNRLLLYYIQASFPCVNAVRESRQIILSSNTNVFVALSV